MRSSAVPAPSNQSESPVPRLSNVVNRENDAHRSTRCATAGMAS